jgi:hypothetical protein
MEAQTGFFKSVKPLADYKLEIEMETGSRIMLDMARRVQALPLGNLRDKELFRTAHTDGVSLLFGPRERLSAPYARKDGKDGSYKIAIDVNTFMDILLIDRSRDVDVPEY